MWSSSKGILISKTQYADSKYILKIFTPEHGVGSYAIRYSSSSKKSPFRAILGQNMALVEFVSYNKGNDGIKNAKNMVIDVPFQNIPHDTGRQTVALYMNELILQTVKLPLRDPDMYEFLHKSLMLLDNKETNAANFPLWFALSLAQRLGFGIKMPENAAQNVVDLISGAFIEESILPGVTLTKELSALLLEFLEAQVPPSYPVSRAHRSVLLGFMADYFAYHADFDAHIKSADVLSVIFA